MKEQLTVENVEGLAEYAQKCCYGELDNVDKRQLGETKQFYLMGLYEGMQIGSKIPQDKFNAMLKEVGTAIQDRIAELSARVK